MLGLESAEGNAPPGEGKIKKDDRKVRMPNSQKVNLTSCVVGVALKARAFSAVGDCKEPRVRMPPTIGAL